MTDYVVLFPADNEAEWPAGTEADHQVTFDTDREFAQLLKARGGEITGGAGLSHSSQARIIRRGPKSSALVTDGPDAETVEQMSGFFVVTCDDYDVLVEAAQENVSLATGRSLAWPPSISTATGVASAVICHCGYAG